MPPARTPHWASNSHQDRGATHNARQAPAHWPWRVPPRLCLRHAATHTTTAHRAWPAHRHLRTRPPPTAPVHVASRITRNLDRTCTQAHTVRLHPSLHAGRFHEGTCCCCGGQAAAPERLAISEAQCRVLPPLPPLLLLLLRLCRCRSHGALDAQLLQLRVRHRRGRPWAYCVRGDKGGGGGRRGGGA